MKSILSIFIFFYIGTSLAQVGVNTITPQATLDVNGHIKVDEKLFLEAPGDFNEIRGSKLLVEKQDKEIVQYDIENSRYGPINYAELKFENTKNIGIQNYDTKIPIDQYAVTVQGFYVRGQYGETNVVASSDSGDQYIEGSQVYSYKDTDTETWHIKAFVNNSKFRLWNNANIQVNIYLNLIIYRKGLLAKEVADQSISLSNSTSLQIAKPAGF